MNQFEPFCEYVVVSLNGQDGAWFKCFDNKADAERELYAEHYEFGEREPMTADEAPEDANEGDALATNGEILTEYEWIDELGSYLHFPEGK